MTASRRDFLKGTGALIVICGPASGIAEALFSSTAQFATQPSHIDPRRLDSWIAIGQDGIVTAYTGKCDFGQGILTAQAQLVAEELCVPIGRVRIIQCDTSVCPDQGTTSGSQSTPTNFAVENLAQAAATGRETLINMAATRFALAAHDVTAADGVLISNDGQHITYGDLVGDKRFNVQVDTAAKRISPTRWKTLGKAVRSLDTIALATGQFEFVHNVRVPGMLHGRMVRPPEVGATVASVDESSVKHIVGVVKVVVRGDLVGVVAEKQSQAVEAASQLKVKWNSGITLPAQKTFYNSLRKQASRDAVLLDSKDVEASFKSAHKVLKSNYTYPYQAHGSIGASCAVADVTQKTTTVWSATQSAYPTRSVVAQLLGVDLESVRVIYVRGSGCYGLNGADAVSFDAALLSQAAGRPVRVQLSRADEMVWDNFGAACVIQQRAAVERKGAILAWEAETWAVSRGGRPRYNRPGNVVTGVLVGHVPEPIVPRGAPEPTGELRNRSNAIPSYVAGSVKGVFWGAGTVPSERVITHTVASPFFTGPLRSPLRIQNTFAHECFMDELCVSVGGDPIQFRVAHLRDKRIINVLNAAAKAGQWKTRFRRTRSNKWSGVVNGRGVACVAYEGDNGYAALIADVRVDLATGQVQPTKFVVAIDCGAISNPDGLQNQVEGGVLQGMSRALVEEVSWDKHQVTSTDWSTYNSLDLGMEVPVVETVLVDRRDAPPTGAGETAITLVAAAIGNAIYSAAGIRLREVPFTASRVKAALVLERNNRRQASGRV